MKKVMNKIMFAFVFALAFVVGAPSVVYAAEEYSTIDNVNVSGAEGKVTTVEIEGQVTKKDVYYVVGDVNTGLVLKYKSNNYKTLPYVSGISVLRCAHALYDCDKYVSYSVDVNVDGLRMNGFTLPLNGFVEENGVTLQEVSEVTGEYVRGTKLSSLSSVYGPLNTIYVIIDYVAIEEKWSLWQFKTVQNQVAAYTQVLKVIDLSEVGGGVGISSKVEAGKSAVSVVSSVHATAIKYFSTDEEIDFGKEAEETGKKLSEVFATKAENATVVEQTLINEIGVSTDAARKGAVFTTNFEITLEADKHYYVLAIDETGAEAILDVSETAKTNVPQAPIESDPLPLNAGDSQVGKIILIILVGVLVLAATLVIIQKIVDHRRKLY